MLLKNTFSQQKSRKRNENKKATPINSEFKKNQM